jgi:predicted DNA-binding transcriptional regulator AlpA
MLRRMTQRVIGGHVPVPLEVKGVEYSTAPELLKELGITRQTFWRWRQEGSIPAGRRFRGHQLIFSAEETSRIREYANRIEPAESASTNQLALFQSR